MKKLKCCEITFPSINLLISPVKKVSFKLNKLLLTILVLFYSSFGIANQLRFVAEDLPPFHYYDENNKPVGALVEVIEELMTSVEIPFKIELMPFARSYGLTINNENVIMFSLMKSPDRQEFFRWIGQSYKSKAYLVGLNSRTDIKINKLDQAKSFVVGTIRGYHSEKYLKNAGFTDNKNLHLSVNYKHMWNMLFEQHIDFILTNFVAIEREMESIGFHKNEIKPIIELHDFPGDLFLATSLSTNELNVTAISNALKQIKDNGTYAKIMKKWDLE
ncbi:MAG: transporter substrate-binding domain-containing protein [Colwelliaceae bacterium]|nr:transporter substrate-binding domain-containing protein [Colwelliaceae bacterium]